MSDETAAGVVGGDSFLRQPEPAARAASTDTAMSFLIVARHSLPESRRFSKPNNDEAKIRPSRCILIQPPETFSFSPRGTSGERVGVRGIQQNWPPLPSPLLLWGRRGRRPPPAGWWLYQDAPDRAWNRSLISTPPTRPCFIPPCLERVCSSNPGCRLSSGWA